MSSEKRYIGKFIHAEFIHHRSKEKTHRLHINLPSEMIKDERFIFQKEDQILISIENDGSLRLERV